MNQELFDFLEGYVTPRRLELFDNVLSKRTKYFTVALEDIYQPHNASAVLRTCDCFGLQDIHIIENNNEYTLNPDVAMGSFKWLNMHRYNEAAENTLDAIKKLKSDGYRIVATTPHTNDVDLDDFDIHKGKAAFFFGTELNGLSELMIENADEYLKIPMYGFTESFNISVSAAIIMHHLVDKLHKSDIDWQLSHKEKFDLKLKWMKNSIKRSDVLVKNFLANK